jgi:hypothetical protein
MRRAVIAGAALALAAGGAAALLTLAASRTAPQPQAVSPQATSWDELPWPFPIDQWGKGKAFACKGGPCGAGVTVYIRAKIGFCNCTTGVADDEELERISDFDLVGGRQAAQAPGKPITVAWMKGRSRAYTVGEARAGKSALSIGFNDRCDAIVATAMVPHPQVTAVEPAVLDFLNSRTVLRWAEVTLGL